MNDPVNEDFERTQKLVFVLGQAHHLMATELRAGLKDVGLNLQERGILLTLAGGSAKAPAALAKLLGVHPARMTRVRDKLETSGFVERAQWHGPAPRGRFVDAGGPRGRSPQRKRCPWRLERAALALFEV
ncbi:MarR family transcriptional regulator [Paraburkholderia sp. A1RI-2L]|uniref:MarR family transcriptional regulator n=1 Tax=Paraburkholderia sp. A1RI-2L TaxID=3028367 RepID=UPI003B7EB725